MFFTHVPVERRKYLVWAVGTEVGTRDTVGRSVAVGRSVGTRAFSQYSM
jgi:hypothetical protein